jgi:signal transduction histidine kinase
MSDIVWAINPKRDHLSDLLHRMRRFASDVFTSRHIAFQFRAPDSEHDIELGANIRREVFLIFKESVNNVVKHSGCTRAEIEFQIEGDWLVLKVCDNGKGFDSKAALGDRSAVITSARGGNGVPSMRKRAEEMGGQFQIVSGIGEGTTATLRVLATHQQTEMK